jgi:hypothetical protein
MCPSTLICIGQSAFATPLKSKSAPTPKRFSPRSQGAFIIFLAHRVFVLLSHPVLDLLTCRVFILLTSNELLEFYSSLCLLPLQSKTAPTLRRSSPRSAPAQASARASRPPSSRRPIRCCQLSPEPPSTSAQWFRCRLLQQRLQPRRRPWLLNPKTPCPPWGTRTGATCVRRATGRESLCRVSWRSPGLFSLVHGLLREQVFFSKGNRE